MEQKNIEVQRKKGLNLMMKILITAIIPLIILVAFAGLAIRAVGVTVSDKLMQHELKTSVYAVNQTMSILSSGDWNTDGDQLYKGDYNFSEHQDVLDAFKENTGQDVTLSWNTTRMATSIVSQDGSREIGTEIAADVYQAVKEKGSYFVSDTVIDGQKYYGYYEGLYNSDGSMAGLVFTGMTSASVHEIYNDRLKKKYNIYGSACNLCMYLSGNCDDEDCEGNDVDDRSSGRCCGGKSGQQDQRPHDEPLGRDRKYCACAVFTYWRTGHDCKKHPDIRKVAG